MFDLFINIVSCLFSSGYRQIVQIFDYCAVQVHGILKRVITEKAKNCEIFLWICSLAAVLILSGSKDTFAYSAVSLRLKICLERGALKISQNGAAPGQHVFFCSAGQIFTISDS